MSKAATETVPTVTAARAEGDPETLWREANQHYRQALQGKRIQGPDGLVVFSKIGRSKALAGGRGDALRMGVAKKLGELAAVARVYESAPDRQGGIVTFVHALAPVEVDGQVYAVRMVYRESKGQPGSRVFYTFVGYEISEPGAMVRGRKSEDQLGAQGSPGSGYTVAQLAAALNNPRAFAGGTQVGRDGRAGAHCGPIARPVCSTGFMRSETGWPSR